MRYGITLAHLVEDHVERASAAGVHVLYALTDLA